MGALDFYKQPRYYDIAFDFRDVKAECDFLLKCGRTFGGRAPARFFEPACGPGYHLKEMGRRGVHSVGIELSPQTAAYTTGEIQKLGIADHTRVYIVDMRDFTLDPPADLGFIGINSFAYLHRTEDQLNHLRSVHRSLAPRGIYVIEMSHPKRYWMAEKDTLDNWIMERDGTKVHMFWDRGKRTVDPLTQISTIQWEYVVEEKGRKQTFKGKEHQRIVTAQELSVLVRLSGGFEIVDWRGAMAWNVPFTNEKAAWRMVAILRKL